MDYLFAARRHCDARRTRTHHRARRRAAAVGAARRAALAGRRCAEHLRYITNSGGAMPRRHAARSCARALPQTQVVPDVRPHGGVPLDLSAARRGRPPARTRSARRFPTRRSWSCARTARRAMPTSPASSCIAARWSRSATGTIRQRPPSASSRRPGHDPGLVLTEMAVWSGDTVRTDEDGFLYFIGRRDEMIKTSGYRVSPTEVEEVVFAHRARRRRRSGRRAASDARPGDRARRDCRAGQRAPTSDTLLDAAASASADVHGACAHRVARRAAAQSQRQVRSPASRRGAAATCSHGRRRDAARRSRSTRRIRGSSVADDCLVVGGRRLHRYRRTGRPHAVLRVRPRVHDAQGRRRCAQRCPRDVHLHYAMKANPMPAVVRAHARARRRSRRRLARAKCTSRSLPASRPTTDQLRRTRQDATRSSSAAAAAGIMINVESEREMRAPRAARRPLAARGRRSRCA